MPDYQKLIARSALIALAGYVLSGPVAYVTVNLIRPQPAWTSPAVFAENYSFLQDIPYYFGFLLIGGMAMLSVALCLNFRESGPARFFLFFGAGLTLVFCALITFNYICQTTFVRNLALHYRPAYDTPLSTFAMTNPYSLCWAIEMWGYAILGVANGCMSWYYRKSSPVIRYLLLANTVISVTGALWTVADINWVMSVAGLIAYFAWNVLMIVLMIRIYRHSNSTALQTN